MFTVLTLLLGLHVLGTQQPHFEYPDDAESPALEYIESMGFSMTDPATGKARMPLHHLRIYGDGRLVRSKFSATDPFGYETVMLSTSELSTVFLDLCETGLFDFAGGEPRWNSFALLRVEGMESRRHRPRWRPPGIEGPKDSRRLLEDRSPIRMPPIPLARDSSLSSSSVRDDLRFGFARRSTRQVAGEIERLIQLRQIDIPAPAPLDLVSQGPRRFGFAVG